VLSHILLNGLGSKWFADVELEMKCTLNRVTSTSAFLVENKYNSVWNHVQNLTKIANSGNIPM